MEPDKATVRMPFRKILFPVDFSDAATAMVPYVREMAQRFGAALIVLNAFDLVPDYFLAPRTLDSCDAEPEAIPYTRALRELRKRREEQLQQFSRSQLPGVEHTIRLVDGDPATVIEWVARRENTDLIMMPTRGRGRFRRLCLARPRQKYCTISSVRSLPALMTAALPLPRAATVRSCVRWI